MEKEGWLCIFTFYREGQRLELPLKLWHWSKQKETRSHFVKLFCKRLQFCMIKHVYNSSCTYITSHGMVHPTWIRGAQLDMGTREVNTWPYTNIRKKNWNEVTSRKFDLACIWLSFNGKWKTVCQQEQIKSEWKFWINKVTNCQSLVSIP